MERFPPEKKEGWNELVLCLFIHFLELAAKARLKEEWKAIADSRQASVADCLLIRGTLFLFRLILIIIRFILVIAAKQVGGTDKSAAREPYASVSLLDQKEKTRAARALNPIWNTDVTLYKYSLLLLDVCFRCWLHT